MMRSVLLCAACVSALRGPVSRRAALVTAGGAALTVARAPAAVAARGGRTGDLASALADPASADSWRRSAPKLATSASGWALAPLDDAAIKKAVQSLPELSREVALHAATERSFTGYALPLAPGSFAPDHQSKERGVYLSAVSGLPAFRSSAKYDSGTGWPSFFAPFDPDHVIERTDPGDIGYPAAMRRVEVLDARTGAHLGHVFPDGPPPTGRRYCMNAAALRFVREADFPAYEAARKGGGV